MEKHFLWWVEQIILPKNIFLSTIQDSSNFHHFCKVRAWRYSFKNSIFQKLPKIVEKHFLWWVEQIILTKNIFFAQFKIVQIFTIFVRDAPVDIPAKFQFFKNCLKLWRNTSFWWLEQIILQKNIFLAQFKIVQIFTIFVSLAPVDIPSKIQFSKNCLKLWRNTSFDEWNK